MFFFSQNSGTHAADNALQIGFPQTLPLLRKVFQRLARTLPDPHFIAIAAAEDRGEFV